MNGISILVTAWKVEKYLEECLDSIKNQNYKNFEILLGIDNCEGTKEKYLEIKDKYKDLDITAMYMESNKGTYITTNTLAEKTKYDILLRFDSDDIMLPEMLETIIDNFKGIDLLMFKPYSFIEPNKKKLMKTPHLEGIMVFTKKIFDKLGGYKPWRCAADTDFLRRIIYSKAKIKKIEKYLYLRRVHSQSLTQAKETKFGSHLRKKYANKLAKKFEKVETTLNSYIII